MLMRPSSTCVNVSLGGEQAGHGEEDQKLVSTKNETLPKASTYFAVVRSSTAVASVIGCLGDTGAVVASMRSATCRGSPDVGKLIGSWGLTGIRLTSPDHDNRA